jgi:hypothetical protein
LVVILLDPIRPRRSWEAKMRSAMIGQKIETWPNELFIAAKYLTRKETRLFRTIFSTLMIQ